MSGKTGNDQDLSKTSRRKNRIFFFITLAIPVLFFVFLEVILQIIDYGGNKDLFIKGTPGYERFYRINPNVASRYFFNQSTIPTPTKDLFLIKKPKNGYRIFVLGGSTVAGFPYANNVLFSRICEKYLQKLMPDKTVEVVNLGIAAINSISILDFMDEVLQQSPDAIFIYAGHNEFYGALGVGSVESVGRQQWLIQTYLSLRNYRTILFLRNIIGFFVNEFSEIFSGSRQQNPNETLMARIVAEQTIPKDSELYEKGKMQFEQNISSVIAKAKNAGVEVYISDLVSNIRDQYPFISIKTEHLPPAKDIYKKAVSYEKKGDFQEAAKYYYQAKDLDALRFRAPEDFNEIIRKIAKEQDIPVVQVKSTFEKESPHGLIGNNLILEHLHPNIRGYYLIAQAFISEFIRTHNLSVKWLEDSLSIDNHVHALALTALDSVAADLTIKSLKNSWPFKPKELGNTFLSDYKPTNQIEALAIKCLRDPGFSLTTAHLQLAGIYERQGNLNKALAEYNAAIHIVPSEVDFYKNAALIKLKQDNYDAADKILRKSLYYKNNVFAQKWIGQIALIKKDFQTAIEFLQTASQMDNYDSQIVFNLCRCYYYSNNITKAEQQYERLKELAPGSKYLHNIEQIRHYIFSTKNKVLKKHTN